MVSLEEAQEIVLRAALRLGIESVAVPAATGRVLAEEVHSPRDVPLFDNSAVDGFAVRSTDLAGASPSCPIALPVGAPVFAGQAAPDLSPGETHRVMTGAPIPSGADAVVMQEDVEVADGRAKFREPATPGVHFRSKGEEFLEGASLLGTATIVTPPVMSLLASLGLTEVTVQLQPRVAVVGTGDELAPPGADLQPGQIYESNSLALHAAVAALGCPAKWLGRVGDTFDSTTDALASALEDADVLITSGGVSVGEKDHVRQAMTNLGAEQRIWRVAIKPGKPFYFAILGNKLIFGLPGNPVAALVTFQLCVRPALLKVMGLPPPIDATAILSEQIYGSPDRVELVRGTVRNGVVTPNPKRQSSMLTGIAGEDCLIHCPLTPGFLAAGHPVRITPMRWMPDF